MAENDTQIELKKRARRRLVGAIALVTVAAIALPAVMDHEPRPPAQDVQIRIPSQEGSNFTSRVIAGKAPAPARPVAGPSQEDASPPSEEPVEEGQAARPAQQARPSQDAAVPMVPVQPAPEPAAQATKKPEAAPQAEARKPEAKPAPAPEKAERPAPDKTRKPEQAEKAPKPAEKNEKARAEAILNDSKQVESSKSSYVVQLGAYKDEANVKTLRSKLKTEGYNSYTEQVGDRTRVRAGPFPSKDAADKAAARIQKVLGVAAAVAAK